jgi:hypothetical protein
MGHVRLGLVLAALGMVAAGCGDDDDSGGKPDAGPSTDAGKGGSGGIMVRDPVGGKGGAGGTSGGTGTLTEGQQCGTQGGCVEGLVCLNSGLSTQMTGPIKVCARPCTAATTTSDCMAQERCQPNSETSQDGYCINVVTESFGDCGPLNTSDCGAPFECRFIETDDPMTQQFEFIGVCLESCEPEGDADGGFTMGSCGSGQTCLPPNNFCGTLVATGADCTAPGTFCEGEGDTDICFPDDLDDQNSKFSCHQLCTGGTACTTGECTPVRDEQGSMAEICL